VQRGTGACFTLQIIPGMAGSLKRDRAYSCVPHSELFSSQPDFSPPQFQLSYADHREYKERRTAEPTSSNPLVFDAHCARDHGEINLNTTSQDDISWFLDSEPLSGCRDSHSYETIPGFSWQPGGGSSEPLIFGPAISLDRITSSSIESFPSNSQLLCPRAGRSPREQWTQTPEQSASCVFDPPWNFTDQLAPEDQLVRPLARPFDTDFDFELTPVAASHNSTSELCKSALPMLTYSLADGIQGTADDPCLRPCTMMSIAQLRTFAKECHLAALITSNSDGPLLNLT
jgi:hypothetical protein